MLNIKFKPLILVNQFLLCLLAALMIFTPFYKYQKMIFILLLFVLWFASALMIDVSFLNLSTTSICFLIGIVLLDLFLGILSHNPTDMLLGINKMPTFIWGLIYLFYKDKIHFLDKPIKIILSMIAISAIFTLLGNLEFPGASRTLAGVQDYYATDRALYRSMNIGGYGFVFSLVFLAMPVLLVFLKNKKKNIMWIFILVLIVITVFVASYFIGIVLMVVMISMCFINPKRLGRFFVLVGGFAAVVFIFSDVILDWLITLGKNIDSEILIKRAEQFLTGSYFDDLGNDNNRIQIYINSITNWLQRPIFGALQGEVIGLRRSGHSALLGYLETYGVFSIMYYIFYYYIYKNVKNSLLNPISKNYFFIYYICFLFFILIDGFNTFCDLGLTIFFVVPVLFQTVDRNMSY